MAWQERSIMSQRVELVSLLEAGAAVGLVSERMGVSRQTAWMWRRRHADEGEAGLEDRSRRPRTSPERTTALVEGAVLSVRGAHPAWGGRKIRAYLMERGGPAPAASTITEILRRHGVELAHAQDPPAKKRFEYEQPNELWQMDFKGHFGLGDGGRCHPLTVLDDHSRYSLGLRACGHEQGKLVQEHLVSIFGVYGLPQAILCDNGSPWGSAGEPGPTWLQVWLLRLGVKMKHGRPCHPQTQGKDERFHRTLNAEVLSRRELKNLAESQRVFDAWREEYNTIRPHEALGLKAPASRYRPSPRAYPGRVEAWEYEPGETVRLVRDGRVSYQGVCWRVGKGLEGERVALRPGFSDGMVGVCLGPHELGELDMKGVRDAGVRRAWHAARWARRVPSTAGRQREEKHQDDVNDVPEHRQPCPRSKHVTGGGVR